MVVDKSLSRGLADSVLLEYKGVRSGYIADLGRALARIPRKRPDVRSMAEELKAAGERASLTQIIAHHRKWRWAALNAFVPKIEEADSGKSNQLVTFEMVRLLIRNENYTNMSKQFPAILGIQEHAIERLFLRLNVMNAAQVREEIHDAMCLSVLLYATALKLELKQMVLPTKSGFFLCSTSSEKGCLIAKTWLSAMDSKHRAHEVAHANLETYEQLGGESGMANWLGELPINADLRSIEVPAHLAEIFGKFRWLREKYTARPDPEGETWINARMQTNRQS